MTNFLVHILETYRYVIIPFVALFESNLTSLVIGFLGKLNLINAFIGGSLVVFGDLIGDIILYWLGYHKGEKFIARFGKYIGIKIESVEKVKVLFHGHHSKILLVSKLLNGLGFAVVVLFTAGMTHVPFKKYMAVNIVGEVIWTSVLVIAGFFFGHLYATIDNTIWRISLALGVIVIGFFVIKGQAFARRKINL